MKLYKIASAAAGQRWQSSKTGLKDPLDVELPKSGRQGMADFLNASELEVGVSLESRGEAHSLDGLEQAEARAVAARTVQSMSEGAKRDWEAADIEDFILNRARTSQVESIFGCLGTRFKELSSGR